MMQKLLEELNYGPKPEAERTVMERRTGRNKKITPRSGKAQLPVAYTQKPPMHLTRDITVRYSSSRVSRKNQEEEDYSQGEKGETGSSTPREEKVEKQEEEKEGEWGEGYDDENDLYGYVEGSKTIVL